MTNKTYSPCNVNFGASPAAAVPDPVDVGRAANLGVKWNGNAAGYDFTGITIDGFLFNNGSQANGDFSNLQITTDKAGHSHMRIDDSVSETIPADGYEDHKYTFHYTDPQGVAHDVDPIIRNMN